MTIAEVTVLGAGIFGLSVAWECARRGARVRVIDPGGVGAGASGGLVGALAPHAPENWDAGKEFQFLALAGAADFWAEVGAAAGRDPGYGRTGRLQPLADAAAVDRASQRAAGAAEFWRGAYDWRVIPAAGAGPLAPASPSGWLVHDTLSARIQPRMALAALAAAITARGGEIVTEGPREGHVIHATGAAGLAETGLGAGIKGQAALLDFAAPAAPQIYAGGVHIVPHADGRTAIGSTTERDYADPTATDGALEAVIAAARAALPALEGAAVVARWAGLRPRSKGRLPLLGRHPAAAGQFIANGGFKIGFGLAPRVAMVMADLALEGRDGIPTEFSAPGAAR